MSPPEADFDCPRCHAMYVTFASVLDCMAKHVRQTGVWGKPPERDYWQEFLDAFPDIERMQAITGDGSVVVLEDRVAKWLPKDPAKFRSN